MQTWKICKKTRINQATKDFLFFCNTIKENIQKKLVIFFVFKKTMYYFSDYEVKIPEKGSIQCVQIIDLEIGLRYG